MKEEGGEGKERRWEEGEGEREGEDGRRKGKKRGGG